jgi:uncharacterized iron-regulated membrane protein
MCNPRYWLRQLHRWGALVVALPFLVVIVTGIILQLKKEWTWVQPPASRGVGKRPEIDFEAILKAVRDDAPEAEVQTWEDIDRLDVRPTKGYVKVQANNHWEVQVDLKTAKVLHSAYRRSDWLEAIHDGSWFHEQIKLWVFLPSSIIVSGLWMTGMYLFVLPYWVKWNRTIPAPPSEVKQAGTRSSLPLH